MTKDEFRQQLEQQATEQMKVHGLSDEEVQSRFTEREQRIQAHQEALANLMGIDTETLNTELENSALPELLDKYNVSHVDLHDAMQTLRDESPHNGRGQRGFDLAQ